MKTRQGLFRRQRTTTRVILNKVSGYVRSGQLLGIIGTSGSGKTTLLNILARRLAPGRGSVLEGELRLNGEPYRRRFGKLVGFVSQHQSIYPTLTAREQIGFAVRLACQPITHRDRLLDALGLVSSQDTLVGNAMIRGLSGGERRRVGVALALAPPVPLLILDEPTTGLDSFNSLTLIRLLHRIAKGGRAVIVTVHQPRTDIFSLFDSLLILTCGEPAYFGPASEAVDFFQTLGHICPLGVNFADFLIDTATVDERMDNVDSSKERVRQIVSEYRTSDYGRLARLDLCGSGDESPETSRSLPGGEAVGAVSSHTSTASETSKLMVPDSSTDDFAKLTSSSTPVLGLPASQEPEDLSLSDLTITCHRAPDPCDVNTELLRRHQRLVWPHQVLVVAHRGLLNYYRLPTAFFVQLFQNTATLIIIALLGFRLGATLDQTAPRDLSGALFFIMASQGFSPSLQTILLFGGYERAVFVREHRSGLYSTSAFYIGKTIPETLLQLIVGLILTLPAYYIIGLNPPFVNFVYYNIVLILTMLIFQAFGLLLAINFVLPMAQTLLPLFFGIFMFSAGYFVAPVNFRNIWIGLQYISPFRFTYEALVLNEFEGRTFFCKEDQFVPTPFGKMCPITDGQQVIASYGYSINFWLPAVILVGILTVVHSANYLTLRFRKWEITE